MKMQSMSMPQQVRLAMLALFVLSAGAVSSQGIAPTNSLQNPYRGMPFGKLPDGRQWGSTAGIDVDRDGKNIWVFERCGADVGTPAPKAGEPFACDGSNLPPILKFDEQGILVKSFGVGFFVVPHGLSVDREGNLWVTDVVGKDGKGQQVFKLSRRAGADEARQKWRRRQWTGRVQRPGGRATTSHSE